MGKRNRNRRDEEELVEIVEQKEVTTQDWFEKNKNLVMGILAAILLVIAVWVVYKYFIKEPKEQAAKTAIYKAEQQFQRDSFVLALENPGGGYEGLLDIIDNYSGTKTANLAKLYAGISYLNAGLYDNAVQYLESHTSSGDYSPIIKNGSLGDAYSELEDFSKALTYYEKATNSSEDALMTPYYLYKLGLLARRNGDNSKALNAFEKIKNKYPKSNEASNIDLLIGSVGS